MRSKLMRILTLSQSVTLLGMGLVFPFYILFVNKIGASFTEFGFAYALFALSAATVHRLAGQYSDRFGRKVFLLLNSWGTAVLFLFFPIVTHIYQVYVLQVLLGVLGAIHKTSEKSLVADYVAGTNKGEIIGSYHGWISIFSALAIVLGGYLADLFSLEIIFYMGSAIMFISGLLTLKIKE